MIIFWGKVQTGHGRGKDLGFPSANISIHKNIGEGIYISEAKINGKIYPALTFIGASITFGDKKYHSETYILDFSGNIYNIWVSIKLLKKIRDNKKFGSVEDLIKAMNQDKKVAIDYFKNV